MNKIDEAMERMAQKDCMAWGDTNIVRAILTEVFGDQPIPQDVEAVIRGKLISYHAGLWDCDNDPTYYEVVDTVMRIISPYLAVNDRRALVVLRGILAGIDAESIPRKDGKDFRDGYYEAISSTINEIDALLAELPEPDAKPFPVEELVNICQEFVDRVGRGEVRSKYTYKRMKDVLAKIAGLKGKP
jgi:hypothetical protein